ncbi:MAG: NVEALA domain-containing protein [Bacteroidaceae bacterium]|nr:NVEALA domain-containing protein [Bacteroidaceae bacterium]
MNKKLLLSIAALAVAAVAGYNVYQSRTNTMGLSDLALANVEALATREQVNDTGCYGPNLYSEVGIKEGKKQYRYHLRDEVDIIRTAKIRRCYATGIGDLMGNNDYIIDIDYIDSGSEVPCMGGIYHTTEPGL